MDRRGNGVLPLLVLSGVVALVTAGFAQGLWVSNLHNGVLALSFTFVGAFVTFHRPGHAEGRLFLLIGAVEAAMFLGRQVGYAASPGAGAPETWAGWLGVWPIAVSIALVTWAVVCFPDGRPLTTRWRVVGLAALAVGIVLSVVSAAWPVEYAAAGVVVDHPLDLPGAGAAGQVWDAVAHPAYALLQVLWVVALATRWRRSDEVTRGQLAAVVAAATLALVVLAGGSILAGTAVPGLLTVSLVPVAAGWAIHRLSLSRVIEEQQAEGRLDDLTPRENDVMVLMARGLSNAAICEELHLSPKTVEPVVGSIYRKLGLDASGERNRRVLAVVEYLRRHDRAD